jgi:hypothetical protein
MRKNWNTPVYQRGYYLLHRDELLARRREYKAAHGCEMSAGDKAYYRGRKALDAIQVETLFDGVLPFLMRRGHRYLKKKE